MLTHEKNTLFDSLTGKLVDYPELGKMLKAILFDGLAISYVAGNPVWRQNTCRSSSVKWYL